MNYLGIKKNNTEQLAELLNELLANYHIYYQNLRSFHWKISGKHFFDLHPKFEELYNEAKVNIDEIAERILTLRHSPMSLMSEYLENSSIKESDSTDTEQMVSIILGNHAILIDKMRAVIKEAGEREDEGTVDLISSYLGSIEKSSWMLDAWLVRA